ncbi:MAG: ABC transporter permease [Magnetococcales bacterium]|nr:ABC transporter permease [Magnetococcales bacterium]
MTNWFGTWAFFKRECHRFLKVWGQTVGAPLISALLYFAIFGAALGSRIGATDGVSYLQFLVPGLAAMGMIQHSYQNTSSSLVQMKYLGMIQADLLALPLTPFQLVLGFVGGAMVRGLMVGSVILLTSRLFVTFSIAHPLVLLLAAVAMSGIFGLFGLVAGIWAKSFDDVSLVGNFLLTPLVYLGGVFFSISMIPEGWRYLALWNPIFYLVDLFRYALIDVSQGSPLIALGAVVSTFAIMLSVAVHIFRIGWRIQS